MLVTKRGRFQKISIHAKKTGYCPVCYKYAERIKEFFQELSPDNRNTQGYAKTVEEIRAELHVEAISWEIGPVYHARCEQRRKTA